MNDERVLIPTSTRTGFIIFEVVNIISREVLASFYAKPTHIQMIYNPTKILLTQEERISAQLQAKHTLNYI